MLNASYSTSPFHPLFQFRASLEVDCIECSAGRVNSNEQLSLRAICGGVLCSLQDVELKWNLRLVLDGSQQDSQGGSVLGILSR